MTRSKRIIRLSKWTVLLVPGSSLLGTSCADDVRTTLVGASLDFVEASAETVLNALIPVDDFVAGDDE